MNKNDDSETRVLDDSTQLSPPQGDEDKTRVITPGLPLPDDTEDLPTRLVVRDGKSVSLDADPAACVWHRWLRRGR